MNLVLKHRKENDMTHEEKQLLLKDLCARIRCGVIVKAQYKDGEGWKTEDRKLLGLYDDGQVYVDAVYTNIENVRPYLRTWESMTDEELDEYHRIAATNPWNNQYKAVDWLNRNHIDYRGLIKEGLAIKAPEDMYK